MSLDQAGKRREALVVLGMHRSGGAAVARLLALAGAGLPMETEGHSDAVLLEPAAVAELNNKILADLGSSWSDPFGPRDARTKPPPLDRYVDEARTALRLSFGGENFIVVKEPRVSLFVDLWKSVLRLEGFEPRFIVVVRHPLEVAQSLRTLHGFSRDRALMMWATYMLAAERGTRGEKRVFVNFDDLLADPEAMLEKIESGLTVALPRRSWDSMLDIEQSIRPDQRRSIVVERKISAPHLSGIEKLFDHFDAASRGQPRNIDVTDEVGAWLASIEQASGGLIKEEERKRKTAEAEVASLSDMRDQLRARERDLEWQIGVWTERANVAGAKVETLEGELAGARAALDVFRQHHEALLAELEQAHDARLQEDAARLRDAEARILEAESRLIDAETRAGEADQKAIDAEARANEADLRAGEAEARAGDADLRAGEAEARASDADLRVGEADARASAADIRVSEAEARANEADLREKEAEARAGDAELKAQEAVAKANAAEVKLRDAEVRADEADLKVRDAEALLRRMESKLHDSDANLHDVEIRLRDSEASLREAEERVRDSVDSMRNAEAALRNAADEQQVLWQGRIAEIEQSHRARIADLEAAAVTADQARLAAEAGLSTANSTSAAERARLDAEQHAARLRAAAELAAANTRIEMAGAEARAARDQSSDLARELTAVIADRGQFRKYSAIELQLAVLRRLWPFG